MRLGVGSRWLSSTEASPLGAEDDEVLPGGGEAIEARGDARPCAARGGESMAVHRHG